MLSYEYFTSIFFKIHLFTPLYFRTCLFLQVLQSCMCCPAHTTVVFSGHPIGGILVGPGSGTVAVAEQTWLAYPWVDGCQSSDLPEPSSRVVPADGSASCVGRAPFVFVSPSLVWPWGGTAGAAPQGWDWPRHSFAPHRGCWQRLWGAEGAWGGSHTAIPEEAQARGCCQGWLWPGAAHPAAPTAHGEGQRGRGCVWPGRRAGPCPGISSPRAPQLSRHIWRSGGCTKTGDSARSPPPSLCFVKIKTFITAKSVHAQTLPLKNNSAQVSAPSAENRQYTVCGQHKDTDQCCCTCFSQGQQELPAGPDQTSPSKRICGDTLGPKHNCCSTKWRAERTLCS